MYMNFIFYSSRLLFYLIVINNDPNMRSRSVRFIQIVDESKKNLYFVLPYLALN